MDYYNTLRFGEYISNGDEIRILKDEIHGHHPAHSHDFIEIAYIDSGKGVHTVNGKKERVLAGDLFLFNAHDIVHSFDAEPDEPLIVYNCLFQPLSVDSSFTECQSFVDVAYHYLFHTMNTNRPSENYIKLKGLKFSETERILYEMDREYTARENGYLQVLKADLMRLLIQMFRLYKSDSRQKQNPTMYNELIVRNAVSQLKENYAANIKCEWLAKEAYISVNHFRKVFKDITGVTVIEMLQSIRIDAACGLLENDELSVAEIAHRVGYSDVKYFYKIFSSLKNMTPGEYRKQYNENR